MLNQTAQGITIEIPPNDDVYGRFSFAANSTHVHTTDDSTRIGVLVIDRATSAMGPMTVRVNVSYLSSAVVSLPPATVFGLTPVRAPALVGTQYSATPSMKAWVTLYASAVSASIVLGIPHSGAMSVYQYSTLTQEMQLIQTLPTTSAIVAAQGFEVVGVPYFAVCTRAKVFVLKYIPGSGLTSMQSIDVTDATDCAIAASGVFTACGAAMIDTSNQELQFLWLRGE